LFNHCTLIGRTTKDASLRQTNTTKIDVTNLVLAVNRPRKKDEEPQVDFIPIVIFGDTVKNVVKHVGKGSIIAIDARVQVRAIDKGDGTKDWKTEIVTNYVIYLDLKKPGQDEENK